LVVAIDVAVELKIARYIVELSDVDVTGATNAIGYGTSLVAIKE